MEDGIAAVLYGGGTLGQRTRIHCTVKSTFSETRLVPALNDLLIANPSPAAVSRFRMGWLEPLHVDKNKPTPSSQYGTVTRFGGLPYDVKSSLNVWSSGMWVSTATGSSAAMSAAGGSVMPLESTDLQYIIREHMIENADSSEVVKQNDNDLLKTGDKMHLRWNSQKGRIFIDGSHLTHNLELGDEILIDNNAPPLQMFERFDM
jgi:NAD+ kinase